MKITVMHWISKAKEHDVNKSMEEKLDDYDLKRERES